VQGCRRSAAPEGPNCSCTVATDLSAASALNFALRLQQCAGVCHGCVVVASYPCSIGPSRKTAGAVLSPLDAYQQAVVESCRVHQMPCACRNGSALVTELRENKHKDKC
jgi:hypothetical protein